MSATRGVYPVKSRLARLPRLSRFTCLDGFRLPTPGTRGAMLFDGFLIFGINKTLCSRYCVSVAVVLAVVAANVCVVAQNFPTLPQ